MTFEECVKIAEKYIDVCYCREYSEAFVFSDSVPGEGDEDFTGGFHEVAVIRETGEAMSFVQFILKYHPEKKPLNEYVISCAGNKAIKPADENERK